MAGYGTLEWQEEQRRKEAMQQQQPQNNATSQKSEKTEQNVEIIKNVLQKLPEIITKGLEAIKKEQEETKKKLEEEKQKDKSIFGTTHSGNLKALENINKVIDGNLAQVSKGFLEGAKHLNVAVTAIVTGLKLADKITAMQASINKEGYLLGASLSGENFYNKRAAERGLALDAGMFGFKTLSTDNRNKYIQSLSSNYALNLMENNDITNLAKFKGGLEGTLGSLGVSSESLDKLQFNAIERYGINPNNPNDMYQQILAGQEKSRMPIQKFIDNINSISNQSIKYGGTLEYAEGLMAKFGKEVNKGTISLENLTAVSRGIANGSVQQNAGLASYLLQTGNLPAEAMKFAGSPLGLSGWIRNNAENNSVQRGLENAVRQEMAQMGLSDTESKQEYFRMRYSSFGFNLDKKQYEKLARGESLTPDDIKELVKNSKAEQEKDFYSAAKKYYQDTSSLGDNVRDILRLLMMRFSSDGSIAKFLKQSLGEEAYKNVKEKTGSTGLAMTAQALKALSSVATATTPGGIPLVMANNKLEEAFWKLTESVDKNTTATNNNSESSKAGTDPNL